METQTSSTTSEVTIAITNSEKRKNLLAYLLASMFTLVVTGFAGYFLPVWAGCDCTYNHLKSFMIFPGSLFASIIIIYLTAKNQNGSFFKRVYFKYLALIAIPYALISFFLIPISDTLDSLHLGYKGTSSIPVPFGRPKYTNDENGVYLYGKIIPNVDPLTFKFISEKECSAQIGFDDNHGYHPQLCYSADKNTVLFEGRPMEGSDLSTFSISEISNVYSTDKNNAYFKGKKIEGVDIKTFSVLGPWYAKDSKHAYASGKAIESADPDSFRFVAPIDVYNLTWDSYAVDKNKLYKTSTTNDAMVLADYPKTGDSNTLSILSGDYMKDSKNVYARLVGGERSSLYGQSIAFTFDTKLSALGWVILQNVDPKTLKREGNDIQYTLGDSVVFNGHQLDLDPKTFIKITGSSYVKDKNKVVYIDSEYIQGEDFGFQKEVIGADPATFEFIKTSVVRSHRDKQYARDKNNVYINWEALPNTDPSAFDSSSIPDIMPCSPDEARVNGACPNYKGR